MRAHPGFKAPVPILLVFFGYCVVEVLLFLNHQSFRDEAQAWLWAAEFKSWQDYFVVPFEGHPPLWYWILKLLSFGLSFDQARWLTVILAVINGALLLRLLGDRSLLLVAILLSQFFVVFWGFFFRPYTLMLTLLLCALLAHRVGRPLLGTWLMALACGLHFLAGLFYALWLVHQLRARVPVRLLIWPSLLALVFGAFAVLSAMGNPRGGLDTNGTAFDALRIFALPFRLSGEPWLIWVGLMGTLIGIAFWRDKFLLAALLACLAAFCFFGAFVYGVAEWHFGFIPVLVLVAFLLGEERLPVWPVVGLMVPQFLNGLLHASVLLVVPYSSAEQAYAAIAADAGDALVSERNLISWPDFVLTAPSALHEFRYISGNTGNVIGPVVYSADRGDDLWSNPNKLPSAEPSYWIACRNCERLLESMKRTGFRASVVQEPTAGNNAEAIGAYRFDRD
ncbi:MAG: hypothetical protein KKB37_03700 [Alphaproteobacteria bacterium]|nr:hypothetical protein [Alphaproteobacteria bacterium]